MSLLRTNKKMKQKGDFATRVPKIEDFTEYVYSFVDGTKSTIKRTDLSSEMDADMYQGLKDEANNNRAQMEEHGAYAKTEEGQEILYNKQESDTNLEADVISIIENDGIRKAVFKLPELQKEAIVKKFWYGMSNTDIAKQTGVSEGAIRDRLTRAIKNLEKELQGKI